jgi:hypothetical protein
MFKAANGSKQMTADPTTLLQISEGYRGAKKITSLCVLGLGWSTAQFEVKSLKIGPAGVIDLSQASISLVLGCGIAYMMTRCTIEYAMQTKEVRQWHLAQTDFRLLELLIGATLLMIAASGLNRSIDTAVYVAIGIPTLVLAFFLLFLLVAPIMLLLIMRIKPPRYGRLTSIVPQISAAEWWSQVLVFILVCALLVALGVTSLTYEPLLSLWIAPPSPLAVAIIIAAVIAVLISLRFHHIWEK